MKKISVVVFALALAACDDKVSQDIVDQNQVISRDNATMNARRYAAEVYPKVDTQVLIDSDSTISASCRYGDGWASGKVVDSKTGQPLATLKCQTNGTGKGIAGCMTSQEFKGKTYADDDGKCQNLAELRKFK